MKEKAKLSERERQHVDEHEEIYVQVIDEIYPELPKVGTQMPARELEKLYKKYGLHTFEAVCGEAETETFRLQDMIAIVSNGINRQLRKKHLSVGVKVPLVQDILRTYAQ